MENLFKFFFFFFFCDLFHGGHKESKSSSYHLNNDPVSLVLTRSLQKPNPLPTNSKLTGSQLSST